MAFKHSYLQQLHIDKKKEQLSKFIIPSLITFSTLDLEMVNYSTANKYCSSAGHHEQKDQKTTGQIKSLAVTVKPAWKIAAKLYLIFT